jgi:hypothetical protein
MSASDPFVDPEPLLREQLEIELAALDEQSTVATTRAGRRKIRKARARLLRERRGGRGSANWLVGRRTGPQDEDRN